MAAATFPTPKFNAPTTDDMDLHSDAGIDLDDGDIELDLDPAPSAHPEDDDVSIKDAATDAGADTQADQDDFMQDNEGFGDQEPVTYGDEKDADMQMPEDAGNMQAETAVQEDEDLIDYSDEEEDTPPANTSTYRPVSSYTVAEADPDEGAAQADDAADAESGEHACEQNHEEHDAGNAHLDGYAYEGYPQAEHDSDASNGEDGGVSLQEPQNQTNAADYQEGDDDVDEDEQAQYESQIRTVTVDYEGNELWLFKQHDTDDSGDWLLDDMSVLHRSLSDLFQALRASLAENITQETELGFRFDHLHNMEIYEDNTACVAVSLNRLLDLYHTLHAQDGNIEPESFCMCLLSRPRFATLLSDVAKHAEQGSGYAGLNAAVSAGETHFIDTYSGHTTEYEGAEFEGEENEGEEATESPSNADPEVEHTEHEGHEENEDESVGNEEENAYGAVPSQADDFSEANAAHGVEALPHDNSDLGEIVNGAQAAQDYVEKDGADKGHLEPPAQTEEEHFENDAVDYSDAEDNEEQPTKSPNALSPSSATAQDDDTTNDVLQARPNNPEDGQDGHGDAETTANIAMNADTQSHVQEQLGDENNTATYEQYDQQVYDQDDAFLDFQPVPSADEPSFGEYTNTDYAGYEDQEVDQQLQNDFFNGAEFEYVAAGDSTTVPDDLVDGDDFLDLDNTAEWAPDETAPPAESEVVDALQDVTSIQEEGKEGVAEQPAAAASSTTTTAISVAASSTDLQQSSPQGLKRSIDEVGDSNNDAIDLTDMKRPRK